MRKALWLFFIVIPLTWADIKVNPIWIKLSPDTPFSSTIITNKNTAPIVMQASIVPFLPTTQGSSANFSTPLVVSPAVAVIPPNAEQVFRVAYLSTSSTPLNQEIAQRLLISDVPSNMPQVGGHVINFIYAFSLPVFVAPHNPVEAFNFSAVNDGKGNYTFSIHNTGNVHIHLSSLTLSAPGVDSKLLSKQTEFIMYVLADSSVKATLTTQNPNITSITVTCTLDDGTKQTVTIPVS